MQLLALLKALHSALESSLTSASAEVMQGDDLLIEVAKRVDHAQRGTLAQVSRKVRAAVAKSKSESEAIRDELSRALHEFEPYRPLHQSNYRQSTDTPVATRVYTAPVKTGTPTYLVLSASYDIENFSVGYVNIFPDGAMITTVDPLEQNGYHWVVGMQGVETRIRESAVLVDYIKKPPSFWNSGFWYMYNTPKVDASMRAEQTFVLRYDKTLHPDPDLSNPFEAHFLRSERDKRLQVIRGGVPSTWEYSFVKDGDVYAEGIISYDNSSMSVWSRAACSIVLDESRLDPFFKGHNEKWFLFFMESNSTISIEAGIVDNYWSDPRRASRTVEAYILGKDWSDLESALFVSPQDMSLWTQWEEAKKNNSRTNGL